MLVKEIMNKIVAIDFDTTLREAAKIMTNRNIGSLVVVKGEKIQGIITENDFVKHANNMNQKVSNVMSKQVVTIEGDEEIDFAADIMTRNKIKRLPVMKDDKLVGIITASDLMAHSEDLNEDFLIE
jgi:CBS domain-containing protein